MADSEVRRRQLTEFAARLGIPVENYDLLDRALTHASAVGDRSGPSFNYESLEFIGDAALGLAVAHYLYDRLPDRTPGEYTKMRAGIVNRRSLARVALRLDIAGVIRLGRGEEKSGGRKRKALLADCMEAIIGALYLDQSWEAARTFVIRVFKEELEAAQNTGEVWDYRSRLQNYCQAERIGLPCFEVVRAEGPDHEKTFEVVVDLRNEIVGRGSGRTKKEAEQNAARAALEHEKQSLG